MNQKIRKLGDCTCDNCGIFFQKPISEIKRNQKLKRKNFCGRKCSGINNIKNFGEKYKKYNISKNAGNKRDEFTGIRDFLRRVKRRNYTYDIDLIYLKKLWETSNICAYTGVSLILPSHTNYNDPLVTASLDRIDSQKGYIKGNVQFISIAANYAKNSMTHEQMLKFCLLIYENKKTP